MGGRLGSGERGEKGGINEYKLPVIKTVTGCEVQRREYTVHLSQGSQSGQHYPGCGVLFTEVRPCLWLSHDLGTEVAARRLIFCTAKLFSHIPVMPRLRSRKLGGELEIL